MRPLSATYIFIYDEGTLDKKQEAQLFDLILRGEPPRSFYNKASFDLESECHKLCPLLHLEWISPSVWQIAVLHAFFQDEQIRNNILACGYSSQYGWEPLEYEQMLHLHLTQACSLEEIAELFDSLTRSLPKLPELFFQVNNAVVSLYKRAATSDLEMLRLAIAELPPFNQWAEKEFPFWKSPWIYNQNAARIFYDALGDEALLSELLKIERIAQENGQWVLYRGYTGSCFPSTLQQEGGGSHALSFGSTLLGGAFFSLEAMAMAYAKPEIPTAYSFLALRVSPEELREFFRIGPLHPFVQMLVNGEMFHAHTKISANKPDEYLNKPLDGYFMKSNRHCYDPVGFVLNLKMNPEELEQAFVALCKRSGYVFFEPKDE